MVVCVDGLHMDGCIASCRRDLQCLGVHVVDSEHGKRVLCSAMRSLMLLWFSDLSPQLPIRSEPNVVPPGYCTPTNLGEYISHSIEWTCRCRVCFVLRFYQPLQAHMFDLFANDSIMMAQSLDNGQSRATSHRNAYRKVRPSYQATKERTR